MILTQQLGYYVTLSRRERREDTKIFYLREKNLDKVFFPSSLSFTSNDLDNSISIKAALLIWYSLPLLMTALRTLMNIDLNE